MSGVIRMLFGLMGGLAMFLWGMDAMAGALEAAAGDGMRRMLAAATKTPLLGALAGAGAAAVLQSSSAVSVAVVGFVSARLMELPGAVAVLFGANVGTTVTGQLLAFRLADWLGPALLLGLLLHLAGPGAQAKRAGLILFSFGLLFTGMETMSAAMEPLTSSERFAWLMLQVARRPLLGVLLGAAMTAAAQSSSAAVAVLQSLASRPGPDGIGTLLGLGGAIPLLLGCNIGTTVTALIAAAGQSEDARRAALAHCLFNVSGSLVCLAGLPVFTRAVLALSPGGSVCRQIANAHTLFNLLCTALWLPFVPVMVRLVGAVLPDKKQAPSEERACR